MVVGAGVAALDSWVSAGVSARSRSAAALRALSSPARAASSASASSGATAGGAASAHTAHRARITGPDTLRQLGDGVKAPVLLQSPHRDAEFLLSGQAFGTSAWEARFDAASVAPP